MKSLSLLLVAAGLLCAGTVNAQPTDLLKSKNCMGCHDIDKKKVGPAFKDIAVKYKGNKEAEAKLAAALKDGKGHVKVAASDAELKTLVQFALSPK